jgi:hypothetical protein
MNNGTDIITGSFDKKPARTVYQGFTAFEVKLKVSL